MEGSVHWFVAQDVVDHEMDVDMGHVSVEHLWASFLFEGIGEGGVVNEQHWWPGGETTQKLSMP